MNNNPHKGLHNVYLFLGILVALILIWQFVASRSPTTSTTPIPEGGQTGNTPTVPVAGTTPTHLPTNNNNNPRTGGNCHAEPSSNGVLLAGVNSITVNNGEWVDIEWYRNGDPEKDSILNPGTYDTSGLSGKYWRFVGCSSSQQVQDQVNTHIQQRLNDHANNVGSIVPFNP